jgi:hypothetical protein
MSSGVIVFINFPVVKLRKMRVRDYAVESFEKLV